jgi:hypothetical protein
MDYQEFKNKLKECNLTIKEFANITGLNEKSISGNWKKAGETPKWVDAFLEHYQKSKLIDDIKNKICPNSND